MQIVVVGGGFGGVKAALELSKNKRAHITLISDSEHFQYYPALYSTATGGSHMQSWIPLGEIFAGRHNVTIIIDRAVKLDRAARLLTTASGATHSYERLVLSLGSTTTYFGIEGLNDFSYGIKSYAEIQRLKQHLIRDFSEAHAADSQFLVVGAGPTGVELASSLGDYLKHLKDHYKQPNPHVSIKIIEAAPRVLPRMSERASAKVARRLKKLGVQVQTNKKVEAETPDALIVSGKALKTETVVWTSGVANSPFFKENADQFELSPNGKVVVDTHLRVDPRVYVIGDNAFTPFSGLAQTALHDGVFVAKHILRKSKRAYHASQPPVVVPVGERWAVFEYKKILIGGFIGHLIRQAADFIGYRDILPFWSAVKHWHSQTQRQEDVYISEFDMAKE